MLLYGTGMAFPDIWRPGGRMSPVHSLGTSSPSTRKHADREPRTGPARNLPAGGVPGPPDGSRLSGRTEPMPTSGRRSRAWRCLAAHRLDALVNQRAGFPGGSRQWGLRFRGAHRCLLAGPSHHHPGRLFPGLPVGISFMGPAGANPCASGFGSARSVALAGDERNRRSFRRSPAFHAA